MGRHIVSLDLELTGLSKEKDQIIQFAAIKFDEENKKVLGKMNYFIQPEGEYTITLQAYLKHNIKPEFLKDKPYFKDVAQEIKEFIDGCTILTYNGTNCDVPFLMAVFKRAGVDWDPLQHDFFDAFMEEKRRNGNKLEETYERYYGKSMVDDGLTAHDAFSDVLGTIKVFYAQQQKEKYEPFTPMTADNFIKVMTFKDKEVPCFTMGKYKDLPCDFVKTIDKPYLEWCVSDRATFCESTKELIRTKYLV